ncbi:hypothetical protein SDC9_210371 [bioreactor metagenome]|uniref:Uncharacterized protein n=1 Tax=bioreactor metagenome TaxID=1076179 RepID=A0A645JIV9_9ZZZZ
MTALGHIDDALVDHLVRLGARDGLAVVLDLAGGGLDQAGDRVHQGRLAGTVGADDRDHLMFADRHRHVEQRLDLAIEDIDSRYFKHFTNPPILYCFL